jgi:hypothetical protein
MSLLLLVLVAETFVQHVADPLSVLKIHVSQNMR